MENKIEMSLGKINECWVCYQLERYKNPNLKQICSPVRAKKRTICEGLIVWLCPKCKKHLKVK